MDGITERPVALVADALTRSFEGYVVSVDVSARGFENRFRPEKT
jgi:hypothetical protein